MRRTERSEPQESAADRANALAVRVGKLWSRSYPTDTTFHTLRRRDIPFRFFEALPLGLTPDRCTNSLIVFIQSGFFASPCRIWRPGYHFRGKVQLSWGHLTCIARPSLQLCHAVFAARTFDSRSTFCKLIVKWRYDGANSVVHVALQDRTLTVPVPWF